MDIERELRIAARPETVFRFFTEPELLLEWMGIAATLEPVPGGAYRVVMDGTPTVRGEFVEVDAPTRVVFTWGYEGDDPLVAVGASTVEVTLRADGDGTLLRLVHSGLTDQARELHIQAWPFFLDRLREVCDGR
jgi:uncharacterized protein YndB with AHSA1/START domain